MYGFGLCRSRLEDENAMRGNEGELGGHGVLGMGMCTEEKERAELEVAGASSKVKPLHHKERHT